MLLTETYTNYGTFYGAVSKEALNSKVKLTAQLI
jgi:hypothetical protein